MPGDSPVISLRAAVGNLSTFDPRATSSHASVSGTTFAGYAAADKYVFGLHDFFKLGAQAASALNVQGTVNRFVGNTHAFIIAENMLKPCTNAPRGPPAGKAIDHYTPKRWAFIELA